METDRLRQFIVFCETQNLRKAADLVHMSHSAFHKSLQVLQKEVKVQLYTLNGRNIVITAKGLLFLEKAKEILEVEKKLFNLEQKKEDSYRIATHETFATFLLAPLWKKYFGTSPLSCHEMIPGRIEEAVFAGLVDLGISYEPIARSGVDFLKVSRVEMQVFALKGVFDQKKFSDIPFVAPIKPLETLPTGARGLDGWPDSLVERKVSYKVELLSTAMQLVADGACAIFIPEFVARVFNNGLSNKKLSRISLPASFKKVYRDVSLIYKLGTQEGPEIRSIAKMIRGEI